MIKPTKKEQIKRQWFLFDAKGQILGRLASKMAPVLIGKRKSYFVRNLDCGDYIVVINAGLVEVTGKKESQKKYTSYSGYPGGLRVRTLAELRKNSPEEIIKKAVFNMLPKNKLRSQWIKKLYVFAEEKHDFEDKFLKVDGRSRKLD